MRDPILIATEPAKVVGIKCRNCGHQLTVRIGPIVATLDPTRVRGAGSERTAATPGDPRQPPAQVGQVRDSRKRDVLHGTRQQPAARTPIRSRQARHDLQRTAHHEAAHAVADLVFGHRPQLVSIRPTDRYNGVCQSDRTIERDGFRPDLSVPQQPADVRASVESEIIAALVGPIAGMMFWPQGATYRGSEPDEQVAQEAVLALGPRYRELLSDLETNDEPLSSDEDKAFSLASAFAGPSQEAAYYGWLRSVAVEFVTNYAKPIHDVAEALLRRTVLSGEEIAVIVKGTTR